jgi:hypothetical protein
MAMSDQFHVTEVLTKDRNFPTLSEQKDVWVPIVGLGAMRTRKPLWQGNFKYCILK